jgi:2-oxoglutarate ferredoxin oxidoreductase subunit delta
MEASPDVSGSPVRLDLELCKACGICIELCPDKVFDRDKLGNPVLSRPEDCSQCLICELHCPDFAIEVRRRERKAKTAGAAGDEAKRAGSTEEGAGAAGAPALTRDQLVAASTGEAAEHDGCSHDGVEG